MALDGGGVVNGNVHRQEALGGAGRPEPLHFALPSADRLVGGLGAVVLAQALPQDRSLSVVTTTGAKPCLLSSSRAAALFILRWTRTPLNRMPGLGRAIPVRVA